MRKADKMIKGFLMGPMVDNLSPIYTPTSFAPTLDSTEDTMRNPTLRSLPGTDTGVRCAGSALCRNPIAGGQR